MNDKIPEDELSTPKSDYDNVSLKMGIASIIMVPLAIYFFYDRVAIFGFAFLFGSPILAIFGLTFLKGYKNDFVFFNAAQQKKFKITKIVCIVSLCISLLTILFGALLFVLMASH
jgi:hypothetical protein